MHKKCITLAVLLLPAFCVAKEDSQHLRKLREEQYKKALELQHLGELISKSDEYIRRSIQEYPGIAREFATHCNNNPTSIPQKSDEIKQKNDQLFFDTLDALRGDKEFAYDFSKELFETEKLKNVREFDSAKFICIRIGFEHHTIRLLIQRYEKAFQEYLELIKQISYYEQQ